MPTHKTYNMWDDYHKADLFLITTNSFVKNGKLVMGAGIAKEAKNRFPDLPLQAGKRILKQCGNLNSYGLLVSENWPKNKIGLFQTKRNWQDKSSIEIIKRSLYDLDFWLIGRDDKIVCLPFPGIGNGGLSREEILPLLEFLPDNVWVYSL